MKTLKNLTRVQQPLFTLIAKFSTTNPVGIENKNKNHHQSIKVNENEFKGLPGISKCVINEIDGPEPNYQSLSPNTYKLFKHNEKFMFRNGGILPEINLAYETWGTLNESKSNAILLFTGLSANSHAKSTKVIAALLFFVE